MEPMGDDFVIVFCGFVKLFAIFITFLDVTPLESIGEMFPFITADTLNPFVLFASSAFLKGSLELSCKQIELTLCSVYPWGLKKYV